ncbi:hypothetical protein N7494_004429 [Penicillium frequentans]|uniref:Uncharacterized protein n=1 Tax=Penicillium frequentans TaxID=3151616 RepID=A0AAD6D0T4_9EURO|nr:hypothetical protein N7494_004429 [Penicillium glabrum]
MNRCASPVFESNSSADADPELTHSNGYDSQLSSLFGSRSPSTVSDNDIGHVNDIAIDNSLDFSTEMPLGFDPLEGFQLTADELAGIDGFFSQTSTSPNTVTKLPTTSNKRTFGLTFEGDGMHLSEARQTPKRQALCTQSHEPSIAIRAPLVMPTVSGIAQTPVTMKPPRPISSHVVPAVSSPTPASIASKDRFDIGSSQMAAHSTNEVTSRCPPKADHLSPYQRVGYNPSTPAMHSNVVQLSNEMMNQRIALHKQRAAAVTAERNKLQKGLLQYTQIDPVTGLLGIDKMKSEIATMRRLLTLAKNKEASEIEIWRTRYAVLAEQYSKLAQKHDDMRRQYEQSAPFHATPTYPPALRQQPANTALPVLQQASPNPPTSRNANTSTTPPRAAHRPPAFPQDAHQVIDLTTDIHTESVSAQGTRSPETNFQGNNSLPKDNSLTEFHRQFRNKKMDWLHNSETTSDAKSRVFEEMNPPVKGRLGKVSFAECSQIVEAKNVVRLALGGQFKKAVTADHAYEESYEPTDEELANMMDEELSKF